MGFIFLAVLFFVLWKLNKSESITTSLVINKKKCPPHEWFWQEIVDQDGNKQGQRIVCKVCGPLSKQLEGSIE